MANSIFESLIDGYVAIETTKAYNSTTTQEKAQEPTDLKPTPAQTQTVTNGLSLNTSNPIVWVIGAFGMLMTVLLFRGK